MQVIRLTPAVIDGIIHWSTCVKEEKMEEEDFLKLNDPNVIPFYEIWEQEKTKLSDWCGKEVYRNKCTINEDKIAYNDKANKYILIRATKFHVLIRIESVNIIGESKTVLLDFRYANPNDWELVDL